MKRGVSLIVLVITIIVMIILAGTIVISLNSTDIIGRSQETVNKTNLKTVQQLASTLWADAYMAGKTEQPELKDAVIAGLTAQGIDTTKYKVTVTTKGVKVAETVTTVPVSWKTNVTAVVDGVPIPKGFVASQATGEDTKEGGFVIYEGTAAVTDENVDEARRERNQYVWVPVYNFSNFKRQSFGTSRVIAEDSLGVNNTYWELILDSNNMPASTQNTAYVSNATLTEAQAMYASVKQYGGFYIARYEAGLNNYRTSNTTITKGNAVYSVMGKYPYNWIKWGNTMSDDTNGAVEVARSIYTSNNSAYGVVSTLTYGVQWDAVLQWWLDTGVVASVTTNTTDYGNDEDHVISSYTELNDGAEFSSNYAKTYSKVTSEYTKAAAGDLSRTDIY